MRAAEFDLATLRRDYGDVLGEARACRSTAALLDFSFMRRIRTAGPHALHVVQKLAPRPLARLTPGRISYALRLEEGRVVVDLTVWRLDAATFEVFSPGDDEFLIARAIAADSVDDLSAETAILSVQGPDSLRALANIASAAALRGLDYFAHADIEVAGVPCRIGRLGYTGERGFEIIVPRAAREAVWTALARAARPAGFASADILRIEAGFLLFANELGLGPTPEELGLARFAPGLADHPARLRLIAFRAECDSDPVLWRPSRVASVPAPGAIVVTSACRSIVADGVLGLGFVPADRAPGDLHDPAGRFRCIWEVGLPFFDPGKRRPRGGWLTDLSPA